MKSSPRYKVKHKPEEKTIWKIRDLKTLLYSNGGISPRFEENGKFWRSLGSLKCHLAITDLELYKSCEIVPFVLTEDGPSCVGVLNFINEWQEDQKRKGKAKARLMNGLVLKKSELQKRLDKLFPTNSQTP